MKCDTRTLDPQEHVGLPCECGMWQVDEGGYAVCVIPSVDPVREDNRTREQLDSGCQWAECACHGSQS